MYVDCDCDCDTNLSRTSIQGNIHDHDNSPVNPTNSTEKNGKTVMDRFFRGLLLYQGNGLCYANKKSNRIFSVERGTSLINIFFV